MAVMHHEPDHQQIPVTTLPVEWHVASVIVHTQPAALAATEKWLRELPKHWPDETLKCAEIHAQSDQGKLVLVLESTDAQAILDVIDQTSAHPGVVNAALVYHEVIPPEEQPQ
ncbi:chaperone NapD [Marinimicrobium sp. C6131]|uniref:chaperone NapD n=1 Tax=Marinimicrobium sp. C6131 TaxID=3022676 RepID=UPI00223DD28E|nr:chaperone NapD [Marinimicrobium sp. C6131]UZJ43605.1 chaperone NapD [Marinimicrobium sp. C6131]